MKLISMSVASVSLLAIGGILWHGGAQSQPPAKPAKNFFADPLADWLYPDAKNVGESNGERLPSIPLHGIQLKTDAPIDKVFFFYRKKIDPRFNDRNNGWQPETQPALLVTQFAQGAQSWTMLGPRRKDADSALMIIHQHDRTITVQISRDPADKSTTDILLVADEQTP